MAPSNPRPTDAELEALMARFGVRERIRQPEVQASLLRILARSKGIPVPPQPVVVKKPESARNDATLRSLVQSMALGLTIEEMPAEEAALLTEILGDR